MQQIVGVKFKNTAKIYYFSPAEGESYARGATVIVETAKGQECGMVVIPLKEVTDEEIAAPLKPVIRTASEKDLQKIAENEARRPQAMKICREQIQKHGLEMKLIDCEFTLDGTKVVFYFSAPTRVDFRDLVRDLASEFHLRIELRQVGIRDETRILGGIAPCGRPCCCSCGLSDFKKVTIKMAKTQGLSLNPGKISGLCGRLMCCLDYENDYYAGVCKQMPKIGAEISSPEGRGTVVSVNMLKMEVKLKIETKEGGLVYKDFPVSSLQGARGGNPDADDAFSAAMPDAEKTELLSEEEGELSALEDEETTDSFPSAEQRETGVVGAVSATESSVPAAYDGRGNYRQNGRDGRGNRGEWNHNNREGARPQNRDSGRTNRDDRNHDNREGARTQSRDGHGRGNRDGMPMQNRDGVQATRGGDRIRPQEGGFGRKHRDRNRERDGFGGRPPRGDRPFGAGRARPAENAAKTEKADHADRAEHKEKVD